MKKTKVLIYLLIELTISAFILFTSTYSQQHNVTEGNKIALFINRIFFANQLNQYEIKAMVGLGAKIIGHYCLFMLDGLFGFLIWKEFKNQLSSILLLLFGFLISGLGEFIQLFSLERSASFHDVIMNFSAYVFILVCYLVSKRRSLFFSSK